MFFISDTHNACFVYFLPTILKSSGKKQTTIRESQYSLIRYVIDAREVEIENKKEPFLLSIGKNKYDVVDVIVYFDGIYYKCNTFLHALETCFKIYMVFNIEYPKASHNVWLFIQTYFYKIKYPNQKINPNIHRLIAKLEIE